MIRVVIGIVKKENKYLLDQRPLGKPYCGYWEFPGGKIEENESGRDALTRELHEELDINVISAEPLFQHTHTYPDKTVLLDLWLVTEFSGTPRPMENQHLCWATYNEMQKLNVLEGNLSMMDKLKMLME